MRLDRHTHRHTLTDRHTHTTSTPSDPSQCFLRNVISGKTKTKNKTPLVVDRMALKLDINSKIGGLRFVSSTGLASEHTEMACYLVQS